MKELLAGLSVLCIWVGGLAAWITAIIHTAKNDMIAMLIIDLIIPPVGVVHGVIIWFS